MPRAVRRPCSSPSTVTTPAAVAEHLAKAGVNAPAGSFYAYEPARHLGLGPTGAIRAGLAPYTDQSDVDRLVAAVSRLDRSETH